MWFLHAYYMPCSRSVLYRSTPLEEGINNLEIQQFFFSVVLVIWAMIHIHKYVL